MSKNKYQLTPLGELAERFRREAEEEIDRAAERCRERARARIEKAETNRQALALLDGAGVAVSYASDTMTTLKLGFFPNTKKGNAEMAQKVRQVREALGCAIKLAYKEVDDAKKQLICLTLKPADYPTVCIDIVRKLGKKAKCRIVRQKSVYSTLVCEV